MSLGSSPILVYFQLFLSLLFCALLKIPKFHLIYWCRNFMERQFPQSFGRIAQNTAETVPFHKISKLGNQVKIRYFKLDKITMTEKVRSRLKRDLNLKTFTQETFTCSKTTKKKKKKNQKRCETNDTDLTFLLLSLNIFHFFCSVSIVDFDLAFAYWVVRKQIIKHVALSYIRALYRQFSKRCLIIYADPVWLNGLVFVYKIRAFVFEFS